MRIGVVLSPLDDWNATARGAETADEAGLDAIGLWDHYHAAAPEFGYVAGWAALGALAARTRAIRIVPMVINGLHHELGVLAKESSMLAHIVGDRFELGIGAGDWPSSFHAWGRPFPGAEARTARLEETVRLLRLLWSGRATSYDGEFATLREAICAPPPRLLPRVVVGCGGSRRVMSAAAGVADEINVYDDDELILAAQQVAVGAPRPVAVSVLLSWEWDKWPAAPEARLTRLRDLGVDRVFVSSGGEDLEARVTRLAELQARE